MLERILPVWGFNRLQRIERRFRRTSGIYRDSSVMYGELQKEIVELHEAIQSGDKIEIQCELADIIINATELANAEGIKLEKAVTGKVRRNADKYNPHALRRLQRDWGMTPEESMQFAKSRWDRNRDKKYFKS